MFRVLVVDDEKEICDLIVRYLHREGMEVITASSGKKALEQLEMQSFDIIVLDVMMPEMDGFEVLNSMRENGIETPVLFLTAKRSDGDIIQGLGMGADEYITKPFSPAVLTARIKALLRLTNRNISLSTISDRTPERNAFLRSGAFTLDTIKHRIYKNGKLLDLTALEYRVLAFFLRHPGQVFTKGELHNSCWSETYYDDNTVAVYIRRIREKIEDNPSRPQYLLTMRGLGYFFTSEDV